MTRATPGQVPSSARARPADQPTRPERRLRRLGVAMTLLLLAQFILGMVVNLYVTIPKSGNVAGRAHMVLGAALLIVALVLAGLAGGRGSSPRPSGWPASHSRSGAASPFSSAAATQATRS